MSNCYHWPIFFRLRFVFSNDAAQGGRQFIKCHRAEVQLQRIAGSQKVQDAIELSPGRLVTVPGAISHAKTFRGEHPPRRNHLCVDRHFEPPTARIRLAYIPAKGPEIPVSESATVVQHVVVLQPSLENRRVNPDTLLCEDACRSFCRLE